MKTARLPKAGFSKPRFFRDFTRLAVVAAGAFFFVGECAARQQAPERIAFDGRVLTLGVYRASNGVFDLRAARAPKELSLCMQSTLINVPLDATLEADGDWTLQQGGKVRQHAGGSHLGDFRMAYGLKSSSPICLSLRRPAKGPWRLRLRFFGPNLSELATSAQADRSLPAPSIAPPSPVPPPPAHAGVHRTQYVSRVDTRAREVALYLPKGIETTPGPWPVVVALHGMNGSAMAYLRYVLGGFHEDQNQAWHDRTLLTPLPDVPAIIVAPTAFGNAFYRGPGEEDVLDALSWVRAHYAVDPARIAITGASMGGTGAASVAFRHPGLFSRVQALCGYHSYFARGDMPQQLAPWERFLAEERSNTAWADNAYGMPLHVVQGTRDLPMSNGRSLVKRFEELGLPVRAEWPALGHNVWGYTYAQQSGVNWLLEAPRAAAQRVVFRTARMRYPDGEGLHVDSRAEHNRWAELRAFWQDPSHVDVQTTDTAALHVDRRAPGPMVVTLDGRSFVHHEDGPFYAKKRGDSWTTETGAGSPDGPFMDVYHTPITVVYGASSPALREVTRRVAEHWARKPSFRRWNESEDMAAGSGWPSERGVQYPVLSDESFIASGTRLGPGESLLLVGSEASNQVLRALGPTLPIRILPNGIRMGAKLYGGRESGALYIYPRPDDATGYIAVVGASDAYGLQRSLSAPDLLPDYFIYDERLAPAATNIWLGDGVVQNAGFFGPNWAVP